MINHYTFANPEFFYLYLSIPPLIIWYWKYHQKQSANLNISATGAFKDYKPTWKQRFRHSLFVLRLLCFSALIVALARPRSTSGGQNIFTEGIDIILCMDISPSMLAEDLKPNRIEASKKVALDFIDQRPNDRMGLVVFSGESFTQCPLTSDHTVLKNLFKNLKSGTLSDGTAIGEGLAMAVNRIKDSKAKSKVIILLTDGINNSGPVAPLTAAEIARAFDITVYTIGVGTKGFAPYPVQTPFGMQYQNMEVQIDEAVLQKIAQQTHGEYFRATNNKTLSGIYKKIDNMERTRIEVTEFRKHTEEFLPFAIIAGLLLTLEIVLRYSVFKTLP
jgi:Ca-activated chloride channel homolog